MTAESASTVLAKYKVLDLTRARAGPTAVKQLADWGAQGAASDFAARHSADFQNLHRNKRSLALNLKAPEGVAIFMQLAAQADVVIENYRPDVKHRLGVDYESVKAINPRIVYGSISGFGQDGPYANRPGVDPVIQGMGGQARCAPARRSPMSRPACFAPTACLWPCSSESIPARGSGSTPRSSRR